MDVKELVGVTLLVTDTVLLTVTVRDTVRDVEIVADWEMVGVRERVALVLNVVDAVIELLVEPLTLALGGGVPTSHRDPHTTKFTPDTGPTASQPQSHAHGDSDTHNAVPTGSPSDIIP